MEHSQGAAGAGARTAVRGPRHLASGFGMWRARPRLMLLGAVPALIVFVLLLGAFVLLASNVGGVVEWATPFLDGWAETARVLVRAVLALALLAGALAASAVAFVALTLLVGEPFYAHIWRASELMAGGPVPTGELGWRTSLRDSVALFARALVGALVLMVVGLVPVVGSVAAAVGGVLLASWVLASELLARPLEARGYDAAARRRLVKQYRLPVLGFGFAVQCCFWVPLGAVLAMPAAVVGATGLAREILGEAQSVSPSAARPASSRATGTRNGEQET